MKIIFVIFYFVLSIHNLAGNGDIQKNRNKLNVTAPIIIGEKLTVQSGILKEKQSIQVSIPADYHQNAERYPVLYLTDGWSHLTLTRGIVDFLVSMNWIPDLIIVAINNNDRIRDLTPTHVPVYIESNGIRREWPSSGGACRFIKFIKQELFSVIDERYRTIRCRIFCGHSLGGLLGIHAIAVSPQLFDATIAIGPSLWWDHRTVSHKLKEFFRKNRTINHNLFFSLATEDEDEDDPKPSVQMRSILKSFAPEGFQWHFSDLTDETHDAAFLRGLYGGLNHVFKGWRLPLDPEEGRYTGDLAGLKKHYDRVFNGAGFKAPERLVNIIACQ